jgi:phospholipid/cholesterol/gamma-HCH transport system substrate-binding protein
VSDENNKSAFVVPKKTYTLELFVGIFMIVGVGALAYLALNIAQMKFFHAGQYEVTAEFDNVSGLKLGAPVEIAGVQIGEVARLDLKGTVAKVIFTVDNEVNLRKDDFVSIRTKGIIGDRYLKVSPGASSQTLNKDGLETITDTESTVDLEDILGKLIHKME